MCFFPPLFSGQIKRHYMFNEDCLNILVQQYLNLLFDNLFISVKRPSFNEIARPGWESRICVELLNDLRLARVITFVDIAFCILSSCRFVVYACYEFFLLAPSLYVTREKMQSKRAYYFFFFFIYMSVFDVLKISLNTLSNLNKLYLSILASDFNLRMSLH